MAMTFKLSDEQEQQYVAWATEHQKTCYVRPDSFMGLYEFLFFPCGIGDSASVKCPCGEKKHLDAGLNV
jgi:hypothetical protein